MMTLMKYVGGKWKDVRENLRQDLEHIQEWGNALEESLLGNGQNQTIQASTILGSPTPVPKYVASTGAGNNPQWDQVDLASSGVKNRIKYGNFQAATGPTLLLGTGSGSPGAEDWGEISLGPSLKMTGTVLDAVSTGTVTHSAGVLTAHAIVLGNGADDEKVLGSLGTTTTVLHGNAAGDPSFGSIATADIANGAITYAKIQNVSANSRLLGSSATGSGAPPSELILGANLSISGSTLNAAGGGSGNVTFTSATASPPGSPAAGDLWFPSDSFYTWRYSGSAWVPWGLSFPFADPALQTFTWVNQGTATIDATNGGVFVDDPTAGSLNLRVRSKAAAATPYTVTTFWVPLLVKDASFSGIAVGWRDSVSGKLVVFSFRNNGGVPNLTLDKYTNPTTFSASYGSQDLIAFGSGIWLRMADDGTNRIASWSTDGQHYRALSTVLRTDFLTADSVWYGLYINTTRASGTLVSWK